MLEHADHRIARRRVRLVGDRATERDAKLRTELGLDEPIRAQRFFWIVVIEICFTPGGSNPHGGKGGSAASGLRRRELLDGNAEALTDEWHRRQGYQTIVVVIRPTEDRACH